MSGDTATIRTTADEPQRWPLARLLMLDVRIVIGGAVLAIIVLIAVVGPLVSPYESEQVGAGPAYAPPSAAHWLGTDQFGRDLFARIAAGARISLAISGLVALTALTLGTTLGLAIGYLGGWLDFLAGRVLDLMFAFPSLLLALALATMLGPGLGTAAIALVIIYVPIAARFVRGLTLSEREREYVLSARVAGASGLRIITRHILPNISSPLLVLGSSIMAFTALAEASLSYLGVGAQPPTSSWGKMLTESSSYLYTQPLLVLIPGFAITMLVLALNLVGDGLRDHLDPRHQRMDVGS